MEFKKLGGIQKNQEPTRSATIKEWFSRELPWITTQVRKLPWIDPTPGAQKPRSIMIIGVSLSSGQKRDVFLKCMTKEEPPIGITNFKGYVNEILRTHELLEIRPSEKKTGMDTLEMGVEVDRYKEEYKKHIHALRKELATLEEDISDKVEQGKIIREDEKYEHMNEMITHQKERILKEQMKRGPLESYLGKFKAVVQTTVATIGRKWKDIEKDADIAKTAATFGVKELSKKLLFRASPVAAAGGLATLIYLGFDMPKDLLDAIKNLKPEEGVFVGAGILALLWSMVSGADAGLKLKYGRAERKSKRESFKECLKEGIKEIDRLKTNYKKEFCRLVSEIENKDKIMDSCD